MGLLLAIDRRIADNVADLRGGHWDKKRYSKADGLLGKTMGIIGLGSIGLGVAERAVPFGIAVQALAKPGRAAHAAARAEELGITMLRSQDELLSTSDIVTLHVPSSKDTKHLVDDAFLGHMKQGAILLNTSRGDVVDEAALLKALDADEVRAGLDVFPDEPVLGHRRVEVGRWPSTRTSSPPTTSAPRPSRRSARSPPGSWRSSTRSRPGEARNCVNLAPEPARLRSP